MNSEEPTGRVLADRLLPSSLADRGEMSAAHTPNSTIPIVKPGGEGEKSDG